MRNPIHVLKSLEEKASVSNYKYERLYRNLYNPEFYLLAYANIAKSQGSMTQGVDGQTLDNMSLPRINRIIESIRNRTYQPKPAKRKYIPKKNGKLRPLGITSTDDKLVQEVVRMILEAIYEPTFSNNSHGFRPKRSCHTALTQVKKNFTGVTWIVEGDIKACFDNFDHHVLVELLRKRISDEAFIGLIWKFLKAGYMEQREEWCACFVSWCADQCGYIEAGVIPKFSLCSAGMEWFESRGQFMDGSYVPTSGDLVFFDWGNDGSVDHVGIVESVVDGTVYTIEGNSGDKVARRSYPIGYAKIVGYGVPAY